MVDNVPITAGSGTTVAADDVGGVMFQRVKVAHGADGSATDVSTSSGGPLPVQLRTSTGVEFVKAEDAASADGDFGVPMLAVRKATPANTSGTDGDYEMPQMSAGRLWTSAAVEAGETHIGEVGGKTIIFDLTLSVDTAAYGSGDLIAETQQCDGFFRKTDGTGVIQSITVVDEADQKAAIYIVFLSSNVSMGSENSAPSISDANSNHVLGIVSVAATDYVDLGGTSVATVRNIGLPVKAVSGTDDLYVAVISNASTPDYVNADDLILRIGALLD